MSICAIPAPASPVVAPPGLDPHVEYGERPRRVLLTTDTVGGVWTFALELARGLADLGVEVLIASMGAPPRPEHRAAVARLPRVQLAASDWKLEWMDDPWDDVTHASGWLLDLARDFAPDVVHLNSFAFGDLPWREPTVLTAHSCVASWWRAVKGEDTPASWSRYREEVRRGLQAADLVVAPTRAMAAAVRREHGVGCAVVPNGSDPPWTPEVEKEPFILGVGRLWDEAKNLRLLADLAPGLPVPVRLAGNAAGPDGHPREFPNTELLGLVPLEQLAHSYARAALYALPARYEPFGYSVLEAARAGCALVLGDIPSLRENWSGAARFVAPDDREGWHRTLCALFSDTDARATLGAAARARATAFTRRAMTRDYLSLYAGLLAGCGSHRAATLTA